VVVDVVVGVVVDVGFVAMVEQRHSLADVFRECLLVVDDGT
jgi:predicted small integral membrane protein